MVQVGEHPGARADVRTIGRSWVPPAPGQPDQHQQADADAHGFMGQVPEHPHRAGWEVLRDPDTGQYQAQRGDRQPVQCLGEAVVAFDHHPLTSSSAAPGGRISMSACRPAAPTLS